MDTVEISRQANRLKEQADNFKTDCMQVANNFHVCQVNVEDDNPDLFQALKKINERYTELASHVKDQYDQLANVMLEYCYKSDELSKMANVELEKLNAQLEEMLSMQV